MCMNYANFKLWYSKEEKSWIGRGYKNYTVLNNDGHIRWYLLGTGYAIGKWLRANCFDGNVADLKNNYLRDSNNYESGMYPRGFHIWTNIEDAKAYNAGTHSAIFEVIYKNVIAFGRNSTSYPLPAGDCVISEYMKIVKRIKD